MDLFTDEHGRSTARMQGRFLTGYGSATAIHASPRLVDEKIQKLEAARLRKARAMADLTIDSEGEGTVPGSQGNPSEGLQKTLAQTRRKKKKKKGKLTEKAKKGDTHVKAA